MNKPTHDYVARKACGCVAAICYDMADKDTGKAIAEWVKVGYTVERMTIADAVAAFNLPLCNHGKAVRLDPIDVLQFKLDRDAHAHVDQTFDKLQAWNAGKARPG